MIKLHDGELMDLLRGSSFNDSVEVKSISYALKTEMQRLLDVADSTLTSAGIDRLPEKILDVLAVELRSAYYDEDYPIETKREIIKNTLKWYMKAGTPEAMKEFINAVWGAGDITEWFDYTEAPYTPGTFDVFADADLTADALQTFTEMIERVKNIRSHIRYLIFLRIINQGLYAGAGTIENTMNSPILTETEYPQLQGVPLYYGYGDIRQQDCPIIPEQLIRDESDGLLMSGTVIVSLMMTNIIN